MRSDVATSDARAPSAGTLALCPHPRWPPDRYAFCAGEGKLKGWMAALEAHAKTLLSFEEAFALAGDYNVIPTPADCHDPDKWEGDALYRPETHAAFRRLDLRDQLSPEGHGKRGVLRERAAHDPVLAD